MKKNIFNLLFFLFLLWPVHTLGFQKLDNEVQAETVTFTFSLKAGASTSAGVYTKDGTLIRTLWSGVYYDAGLHSIKWDGTDDAGRLVNEGAFYIRVLSNNVKYNWEGVIGNTSSEFSGIAIHQALNPVEGIAISGHTVYYATGYNEQTSSTFKFNAISPQRKSVILDKGLAVRFSATDGHNVYWAGKDGSTNKYLLYATKVSDDTEFIFNQGQNFQTKYARNYSSTIDNTENAIDNISGLAVQTDGQFLFVAHQALNEVHILNKVTGALVRKVSITSPKSIAVINSQAVMLVSNDRGKEVILKYAVNTSGGLTPISKPLINLQRPIALAISPDNQTLVVADGGNSQQLKAYDVETGKFKWTFGQEGGYARDPEVRDDKFYFSDLKGDLGTSIAYAPDGTFWVVDKGNFRLQHYSANRVFLNRIMFLPMSYSIAVDANNSKRVFSGFLEFEIDYTKPLRPNNDSWQLVRNWGAVISPKDDNKYGRLRCVATLRNGKTYGLIGGASNRSLKVIELPQHGNIRFTGIELPKNYLLYDDGSIRKRSDFMRGQPVVWSSAPLAGFDTVGNPRWSAPMRIANTPPADELDPINKGNGIISAPPQTTASGMIVSFDPGHNAENGNDWHLGGVRVGSAQWLWRTAVGTPSSYRGDYPLDGAFDNGNSVRNAGSIVLTLDRYIFWGYHGEFWKASQVNKWNQVYDDGLFIGQFGVTGVDAKGRPAAPGMAGNAVSAALVHDSAGNTYLYHNDENYHSGIHRWKISGLNTVEEQSIPVSIKNRGQGLLTQYFASNNMNNMSLVYSGVQQPGIFTKPDKQLSISDVFSAIWKGYLRAGYTEPYHFETSGGDPVRLWIDGKLIIDSGHVSGILALEANKYYPIKIAYISSKQFKPFSILWSSNSQPRQLIPASSLVPSETQQNKKQIDLLENLPYNAVLENNSFGWQRSPRADDIGNKYTRWWSVHTNVQTYDKRASPDVFVQFTQNSGVYTLTRELTDQSSLYSWWKISCILNLSGTTGNSDADLTPNGKGGNFLEVIDANDKVIARLFFHLTSKEDNGQFYANNKILFEIKKTDLQTLFKKSLPLSIVAEAGMLTIQYGPFPAVQVPVLENESNYRQPKAFRLYFWSKGPVISEAVDLKQLGFTYK